MREEEELALPHCIPAERLQGAPQLAGREQAALGPAPLLWAGAACPGLRWRRGIAPLRGLWAWGGARGAGRVAAAAPCRWLAAVPVASPEAEGGSHWGASAGKRNTSLTTRLSSAAAAQGPPRALGQLHNGEQRPSQKYPRPRWSGLGHGLAHRVSWLLGNFVVTASRGWKYFLAGGSLGRTAASGQIERYRAP